MSDFPTGPGFRPFGVLGSHDPTTVIGDVLLATGNAAATGSTWPSANRALYIPMLVERQATIYQMAVQVTTQDGNVDVGVYAEDGTRLVSSGSTAVAAAGVQVFDVTNTTLPPGGYYLAMSCDSATASFVRTAASSIVMRACGVRQQDSAFALPATATFANVTAGFVPLLSASTVATI